MIDETFPFRVGDEVQVKNDDLSFDPDGNEVYLPVGAHGTVTEIWWDEVWTTHLRIQTPEHGLVTVGWDILRLTERGGQS